MNLSASQLVTIREQPQSVELNLSIFQPRTVLACMVTGTHARGDRVITYDTVSAGSYLSVEAGMTLLVGTTAGARDVGKIRVKSITSSQITVSENSHINWADDLYLTVLRFWEVWPVYPRIIPDPSNSEDVIFYKDYDIAYSNQNTILGAMVCAGNHRAIWAGEQTYWSASGTSHLVGGTTLSYSWAFEGGTSITGSTAGTPGLVTYNTPGHYVTRLIITGSNGSVDTTYRYISVYNKPENSMVSNPVKNWSSSGIAGSRGEGGSHASIHVVDENVAIQDGYVAVLFADDWYGSTNTSLGGNSVNNSKIFFSGHILKNTIRFNYQSSSVDFDIGNITDIMKMTETYAISLEDTVSPTKWFQVASLNARRGIYHYLRWHSTVLYLADIEFVGTDQNLQYFDTDRQSIFDSVDNFMRNALVGTLVSDRQGKLWVEVGTATYSAPVSSFPTVMSIGRGDWMGEPTIQEALSDTLSFIECGGVTYSGGAYQAFLSQAPGSTPNGRGNPENIPGLAISSQAQLNRIAGNIYAEKNAKYPQIDMNLTSGFRNLDIAPMNSLGINIIASDTALGITINAPYLIDALEWSYDVGNRSLLPSTTLTALVNGEDGETIIIPDIPDGGGYTNTNFDFNFSQPSYLGSLGSLISSSFTNAPCASWCGYVTEAYSDGLNKGSIFVATGTFYNYGPLDYLSSAICTISGVYNLIFNYTLLAPNTTGPYSARSEIFPVSYPHDIHYHWETLGKVAGQSGQFIMNFQRMAGDYMRTITMFSNIAPIYSGSTKVLSATLSLSLIRRL